MKTLFNDTYCMTEGDFELVKCFPRPDDQNPEEIHAEVHLKVKGESKVLKGSGNGPISAFANAIREELNFEFKLLKFQEISLNQGEGADASALAYITLEKEGSEAPVIGAGFGNQY